MRHRILAYVYETDTHCPACAERAARDKEDAEDREGNPVGVLFSWDIEEGATCGTCREEIWV